MATYLVTGGAGFIGSHLVESLVSSGHTVRVLDDLSTGKRENLPAGVPLIQGDVGAGDAVDAAAADVDGIFHLAAVASVQRSNEDWRGTHRSNQTGSVNVFEAARRARGGRAVPVVYASSAAVYGDPESVPLAESARTQPLTAYGADKLGSELHGRVAAHVHGVPTRGMRFFNIYGPRQDPKSPYSGVISIFAARVLAGQGIGINGDGQQFRDFVYVADVVRFLRAAMQRPGSDALVFNVCTGRTTTVLDLARTLMRLAGKDVPVAHNAARAGDIQKSLGDPAYAAAQLDVRATVTLDEGLQHTLASLRG